jgi:hypothetical protein
VLSIPIAAVGPKAALPDPAASLTAPAAIASVELPLPPMPLTATV